MRRMVLACQAACTILGGMASVAAHADSYGAGLLEL